MKANENALFLGNILKNGLIVFNIVIRETVIIIIKFVGVNNQTKEIANTATFVFICQLVNTALLLLLSNANLVS